MKICRLRPILLAVCFLLLSFNLLASERYMLCGSDEDGCWDYRYCACIPFNEAAAGEPFCMDFDAMTCKPLSKSPNCDPHFIFKTQGECLGLIYHSESVNPCTMTTLSFCQEHGSYICGEDGNPGSCKRP